MYMVCNLGLCIRDITRQGSNIRCPRSLIFTLFLPLFLQNFRLMRTYGRTKLYTEVTSTGTCFFFPSLFLFHRRHQTVISRRTVICNGSFLSNSCFVTHRLQLPLLRRRRPRIRRRSEPRRIILRTFNESLCLCLADVSLHINRYVSV